jgi:hypothetical protein
VLTGFGGIAASIGGLVIDGQLIVAAGSATTSSATDFALARYQPDGSLDPSFGSNGKVTTDLGGSEVASAVAVQASGIVVAAGRDAGSPTHVAFARYVR